MKTFLFLFAACAVISAQAQTVALHRVGESDLPVIRTQKGFSTLIEFPPNHEILEATCGDKEFWVIEGRSRYLSIKPAKEGIKTNLNVLLDGDLTYSFLLKEITGSGGTQEAADFRVVIDEPAKVRKGKDDGGNPPADDPDGKQKSGIDNASKTGAPVSGVTQSGTAPQDARPSSPMRAPGIASQNPQASDAPRSAPITK